jgi:transposase InsO family protein
MITHTELCPPENTTELIEAAKPAIKPLMMAEATTAQLAEASELRTLLAEMKKKGMSPEQFAALLEKEKRDDAVSASTLRRMMKAKEYDDAYHTVTLIGLGRPGRKPSFSDTVLLLCLPGWCKRYNQNSRAYYEKLKTFCEEKQLSLPVYSTYRRWGKLLDKDFLERSVMKYGDWYALHAPSVFQLHVNANDAWMTDACELGFFVTDGKTVFKPNIVVYQDCASGMPMGWMISKFAINSNDTIGALKTAIMLPKKHRGATWGGKPKKIILDNGGPFKSAQFLANLTRLGIEADYNYPECPQQKGKIERMFRTVGGRMITEFENKIKSVLISQEAAEQSPEPQAYWDTVVRRFNEEMLDFCLKRVHSRLKVTPYESWQDKMTNNMASVQLNYKEIADLIYVERADITVTKAGVEVTAGQFFTTTKFVGMNFGEDKVTVQLPPDGVHNGKVRAFFGNVALGELERNGDRKTLAPLMNKAFSTHEGSIKEFAQAVAHFSRDEQILGTLRGGEPIPKRTAKRRLPRGRGKAKPQGVDMTSVIVGEQK